MEGATQAVASVPDPRLKTTSMPCNGCGEPVYVPQCYADALAKAGAVLTHGRGGFGVLLPKSAPMTTQEELISELRACQDIPGFPEAMKACQMWDSVDALANREQKAS